VLLRPQVYQDILNDQLVMTCDSCGRILYHDAAPQAETPAAPSSPTASIAAPAAAEVPEGS
jgi:hypothetical protein